MVLAACIAPLVDEPAVPEASAATPEPDDVTLRWFRGSWLGASIVAKFWLGASIEDSAGPISRTHDFVRMRFDVGIGGSCLVPAPTCTRISCSSVK